MLLAIPDTLVLVCPRLAQRVTADALCEGLSVVCVVGNYEGEARAILRDSVAYVYSDHWLDGAVWLEQR